MVDSDDLFDQILSQGPSHNTTYLILKKMKEEGRFGDVVRECLKALRVYPEDIRLRSLLAEAYLEVGFFGQAEAELERVTSEIGGLVSAFKLQAKIYTLQQRNEEALESLTRYLAFFSDDDEALSLLDEITPVAEELVPETGMAPEAVVPTLEEIREEEPVPELLEEERDVLEAEEKIEEPLLGAPEVPGAITPAEEGEGLFPDLATPTLAEIYYDQGQIHDGIRIYEEVVSRDPDDGTSIRRLAELRAIIAGERLTQVTAEDKLRTRNERMITILEGWLTKIQERNYA